MGQRSILLITKDSRTWATFHRQITDFFGNLLQILPPDQVDDYCDVDLIVLSANELKSNAFPTDKLLVARRAINTSRLEELVTVSDDETCLVVNNLRDSAYETIELLQNLGFTFKMAPYYPGITESVPKTDIAVIPAGVELVPGGITRVIDIGLRPMDLSSVIEMAVRLNLPLDKANIYNARFIHEIVELSKKLSGALGQLNNVNRELDAILNTVHDGIVATDAKGRILRMNKSAQKMIDIHAEFTEWVGQPVNALFPDLRLKDALSKIQENILVTMKDKNLVMNHTPLEVDGEQRGLVTAFQDVTRIQQLERHLRKELQTKGLSSKYKKEHILGDSENIQNVLKVVEKISVTDKTVLILGESGTGKELVAHSIHDLSPRRDGPFLPVNFAGLPESLAESELFGYEEGSFTGAKRGGKPGLFELAHKGTIFLDEIGDAPMMLQALLLRVLQERQVMRVGGNRMIPVDVRVIAATNRNLKQLIGEGKFREDLYYRLHVLPIRVPPLRERKEDVPLLVEHFIKEFASGKVVVSDEVMARFLSYDWPGNIREMISVVQYMVSVMDQHRVTLKDLPEQFQTLPDARDRDEQVLAAQPDFLVTLKNAGKLSHFSAILHCLARATEKKQGLGRGRIVQYCEDAGISLSDQQVRRRMETLSELGLLKSGVRGQGSQLTSLGLEALQMLDEILHCSSSSAVSTAQDHL